MIIALGIVAVWAVAEAILFFIVADVPISYVAVRYGVKSALNASLIAAVMAAVGGVALVLWARGDPAGVARIIVALPAIDGTMLANAEITLSQKGYWGMFVGSFSGMPYKLYAYSAANATPGGLGGLFLGSIAARLPRFICVALLTSGVSTMLGKRLTLRSRLILLSLAWTAFYAWYFAHMPS